MIDRDPIATRQLLKDFADFEFDAVCARDGYAAAIKKFCGLKRRARMMLGQAEPASVKCARCGAPGAALQPDDRILCARCAGQPVEANA